MLALKRRSVGVIVFMISRLRAYCIETMQLMLLNHAQLCLRMSIEIKCEM